MTDDEIRDALAEAAVTWPGSPLIDALLPVVHRAQADAYERGREAAVMGETPPLPADRDQARDYLAAQIGGVLARWLGNGAIASDLADVADAYAYRLRAPRRVAP